MRKHLFGTWRRRKSSCRRLREKSKKAKSGGHGESERAHESRKEKPKRSVERQTDEAMKRAELAARARIKAELIEFEARKTKEAEQTRLVEQAARAKIETEMKAKEEAKAASRRQELRRKPKFERGLRPKPYSRPKSRTEKSCRRDKGSRG